MEIARTVVDQLRDEALPGRKPSDLSRLLTRSPEGAGTLFLVLAFRAAFGLPLRELALIGGWSADGSGEITDARIDSELGPLVTEAQKRWGDASS
jgi:hypothetical protein